MGPTPTERHVLEVDPVARRPGGPLRWAAIPAAIGLLLLVVVASRTAALTPLGGFDASAAFSPVRIVLYVALILGVPTVPLALLLFRRRRQRAGDAGRSAFLELTALPTGLRLLATAFLFALFAAQTAIALVYMAAILRAAQRAPDRPSDLGAETDPNALGALERDSASLVVALVIVGAVVALVVGFAIKWRLEERRRAEPTREDHAVVTARAVEVSLAALRAERDPRRAVIAAYAAMERVLAAAGLGRIGSEAPIEYLRRVLAASFGSSEEVATITQLFQVAKFSHHDVDEPMRVDAIAALERVRERTAEPA